MEPIKFPQHNVIIAEDQPEYLPLPAFVDHSGVVTCWKLTFWERILVLFGRPLWLLQLTFGESVQPVQLGLIPPIDTSHVLSWDSSEPGVWSATNVKSESYHIKKDEESLDGSEILYVSSTPGVDGQSLHEHHSLMEAKMFCNSVYATRLQNMGG